MHKTEIYVIFLCRKPGLRIFGETRVWLWDLYYAEQEANSAGKNLVGELIFKKFTGLLVMTLLKRG